jgi:F-type H+-transporting ATPase subunit b
MKTAAISLIFIAFLLGIISCSVAAQENSSSQSSSLQAPEQTEKTGENKQAGTDQKGFGRQLAEETREATGDDQEDNVNLKHSPVVRWLAKKTGLTVHQAHLAALFINFAIIVAIISWAGFKFLPGMMRERTATIQKALEEARAASQEANRRLSEIEGTLRRLDVEIGQMQASAEREATAEETRIQKAAEEDIRKVVLSAEQEIAAAAKQARRELANHTAGLAIALASKQINVDPDTDHVLIRTFATTLATDDDGDDHGRSKHGKDGR